MSPTFKRKKRRKKKRRKKKKKGKWHEEGKRAETSGIFISPPPID